MKRNIKCIATIITAIILVLLINSCIEPPGFAEIKITLQSPSNSATITTLTPRLEWNTNSPAAYYHIEVDDNANFSSPVLYNETITTTSYVIGDGPEVLANGTTYYWRVRGENTMGVVCEWSSKWSFNIDTGATPIVVTLENPTDGSTVPTATPTLQWQANPAGIMYHLMIDDDSDFSSPVVDKNDISSTFYTLSGTGGEYLDSGTTYYWRVRGQDSEGTWWNWSGIWSIYINVLPKKLIASDGVVDDMFGYGTTISSDGSTIAVGAFWDDDKGVNSGSVYIYSGSNWDTVTKINASDGGAGDCFGHHLAISGDGSIIVVGATENGSGKIYVYSGTNWETETQITSSDGASGDKFGVSVAISDNGSVIVAGALYDDDNGSASGSAYIYSGTNWSIEKKVTATDAAFSDCFGNFVAISSDGSIVVIGSRLDDNNSGAAYVYSGANWATETKLTASDRDDSDLFGSSVAISGDGLAIVVGAILDDDKGTDSGSIYVYTGTNWATETKLTASDGADGDKFGFQVSLSDDGSSIIAGAPEDDDKGIDAGSAYLLKGTNWTIETKITANDSLAGDKFGWHVIMSSNGSLYTVSAPFGDGNVSNSGSVYVYY